MAELLLVNPSPRRRKKTHRRRRKPSHARRHRRHHAAAPRRHRRRRNPHFRLHRRRRRHNPSLRGIAGSLVPTLKSGFTGALGGIGLDLLTGQLINASWFPATMKSGLSWTAVKIAGALAVGLVGNKVLRGKGKALADGAMVVVLHDALKAQLTGMLPASVPLGEYITYAPTVGITPGTALPLSTGLNAYLTGDGSGLGEYVTADVGATGLYDTSPGSPYGGGFGY
jgi:hypothetical protein